MGVQEEEEERSAVGVSCTNESAISYVAGNVDAGSEREVCMGGVVYCEEDSGNELCCKAQAKKRPEVSHNGQIGGPW